MEHQGYLRKLFHDYLPHLKWDIFKEGLSLLFGDKTRTLLTIGLPALISSIAAFLQRHDLHLGLIALIFTTSVLLLSSIVLLGLLGIVGEEKISLETKTKGLEEDGACVRREKLDLQTQLASFESLRSKVWPLLNQGRSVDIDFLMRNLDKPGFDQRAKEQILGVLSVLLNERKIEGDPRNVGCYRLVNPPQTQ